MKINSIFQSISGEVNPWGQGQRCTFIRFQGCLAACKYCDTKDTWDPKSGVYWTVKEIANTVQSFDNKIICITGGEPLMQIDGVIELLNELVYYGFSKIYIETNGFYDTRPIPGWVSKIVDFKLSTQLTPDQRDSFYSLTENDFVKFVVGNINEFEYCLATQHDFTKHGCKAQFAYSCIMGDQKIMTPAKLLNLMEENHVDGLLNVQIHKLIAVS